MRVLTLRHSGAKPLLPGTAFPSLEPQLSRFGAYLEEIRELPGTRLGSASRTSPGPGAISSVSIANPVGRPRVRLPTPPPPSTTRRRKVFRRRIYVEAPLLRGARRGCNGAR